MYFSSLLWSEKHNPISDYFQCEIDAYSKQKFQIIQEGIKCESARLCPDALDGQEGLSRSLPFLLVSLPKVPPVPGTPPCYLPWHTLIGSSLKH